MKIRCLSDVALQEKNNIITAQKTQKMEEEGQNKCHADPAWFKDAPWLMCSHRKGNWTKLDSGWKINVNVYKNSRNFKKCASLCFHCVPS